LAAKPIAIPPSAAAMTGPALSPHEKALRLSLLLPRLPPELPRLDVVLERFELRLWVRVGIDSSLPGISLNQRTGERRRSVREALSRTVRRIG
jgi:hypothetical protein